MTEGKHASVAIELSEIDKWSTLLYPKISQINLECFPWELDALISAVLATHSTESLANAWNYARSPRSLLRVPVTSQLDSMPHTERLLKKANRLVNESKANQRYLSHSKLANIRFGYKSDNLARTLFPTHKKSILSKSKVSPNELIAAAVSLDCHRVIGSKLAERALPSLKVKNLYHRGGFDLRDYERARMLIIGQKANKVQLPTIHRVIWARPRKLPLDKWRVSPWNMPTLGLPVRVATALFVASQKAKLPKRWKLNKGPLNWRINDKENTLSAGRRSQFGSVNDSSESTREINVKRSTDWEVLPNAAYYLPFIHSPFTDLDRDSYILYCDVLLLLTALDGNEAILNSIVKSGVRGTPFEDRWAWRSRIHYL